MKNYRQYLLLFLIFVANIAWAYSDRDISPQTYAKQEAMVSSHDYGRSLCKVPGYHCEPIGKNASWYTNWPNFQQREMIMRLNRTNVAMMYRNWIVVPKDISSITYMQMSPMPEHYQTHGKKLLLIDLQLFAFGAYNAKGDLLYWGPASGGSKTCPDVNKSCESKTGSFKIFRIHGKNCVSRKYPLETHGGAPMPYCMYYYKGYALHGSTLSGFINRSRGCIRLFYDDAKWLYERFVKINTRVIVRK